MISPEQKAEIRHLFHAEHWKVGTIAGQLGLHPQTVKNALESHRFVRGPSLRNHLTDPYLDFIRETLHRYPRLRATRLYQMLVTRGYPGSVVHLRRIVAGLRPTHREAFLRLHPFPAEQAQVDWASFGEVQIGRAQRRLSCFVLTLSHSRALWVEFFFDQTLENFCWGHVHAFQSWNGVPRTLLCDNLKSVVLERRGDEIHFHPRLLELAAHYHFTFRPCRPARGNEKGRVERAIQYVRQSFFAARPFTTLEDFNQQALLWRDQIAHQRPWPGDDSRSVQQALAEEQPRLLPLPIHPFECDRVESVHAGKTPYVRFDLNDYSIPPEAIGRPLTLVASSTQVRILEGTRELASHRRSFDRHRRVEDPAHLEALLQQKRKALGSTASGRLACLVPASQAFLDAAFQKGESTARLSRQLLGLLDDYGPQLLQATVEEALRQGTPRASSVAFLLEQQRRLKKQRPPLPVHLTHRPELSDLAVPTSQPEVYDALAQKKSRE
jgi:transposase